MFSTDSQRQMIDFAFDEVVDAFYELVAVAE